MLGSGSAADSIVKLVAGGSAVAGHMAVARYLAFAGAIGIWGSREAW